ncbi:uncharacterized protein I303_107935 [Kwoniella dejecticola CBS 10117]|uniref:Uncharacterized protein n=1 Tax=Kwoniella dejecticola CBS 10117 TaxID=1296121 RepID=A0AAJ8MLD0_9TREE
MFGTTPPLHPSALQAISGNYYGNAMSAYEQPMPQGPASQYGGIGFGLGGGCGGGGGSGASMMMGGGGQQAFPSKRAMNMNMGMGMGMGGMGGMGGMVGMPGMKGMGMPNMGGMGGLGMGMGGMTGFQNGLVLLLPSTCLSNTDWMITDPSCFRLSSARGAIVVLRLAPAFTFLRFDYDSLLLFDQLIPST